MSLSERAAAAAADQRATNIVAAEQRQIEAQRALVQYVAERTGGLPVTYVGTRSVARHRYQNTRYGFGGSGLVDAVEYAETPVVQVDDMEFAVVAEPGGHRTYKVFVLFHDADYGYYRHALTGLHLYSNRGDSEAEIRAKFEAEVVKSLASRPEHPVKRAGSTSCPTCHRDYNVNEV